LRRWISMSNKHSEFIIEVALTVAGKLHVFFNVLIFFTYIRLNDINNIYDIHNIYDINDIYDIYNIYCNVFTVILLNTIMAFAAGWLLAVFSSDYFLACLFMAYSTHLAITLQNKNNS